MQGGLYQVRNIALVPESYIVFNLLLSTCIEIKIQIDLDRSRNMKSKPLL